MKRAVATITVYVYGETNEELIQGGKEVQNHINESFLNVKAEMEKLDLVPFGKIGTPQKINFERS
tara:strand:- start:38636 stop:38830 length:195 start_codon:yes stop_codon:yes gene_type:complete